MSDDPTNTRRTLPHGQHVWVRQGTSLRPGLLLWWEKRGTTWWGRVAMVDADGDAALVDVVGGQLQPVIMPDDKTPRGEAGSGPQ